MTYTPPIIEQLKEIFGEQLKEINITETVSDVDDFVVALERAMAETKKRVIQFGPGEATVCPYCGRYIRFDGSYEQFRTYLQEARCPLCHMSPRYELKETLCP